MSIRVGLCVMLRLIRFDTLRRVYNVGFLAGRLISVLKYLCCSVVSFLEYVVIFHLTTLDAHLAAIEQYKKIYITCIWYGQTTVAQK